MTNRDTQQDITTPESRQARRAFRKAMSSGLKRTYDRVTTYSVPDDFMELLETADKRKSSRA
ncbi:NepR family anti-sigma factor [Henriciella sp.]|uniref:NepR family anti-sigma factor n=1 Tax=Henriciella sp. TaxID=1968823 RepID=UPI00262E99B6|nr:NepR family anti-sigma factor [Henriciella sp.]